MGWWDTDKFFPQGLKTTCTCACQNKFCELTKGMFCSQWDSLWLGMWPGEDTVWEGQWCCDSGGDVGAPSQARPMWRSMTRTRKVHDKVLNMQSGKKHRRLWSTSGGVMMCGGSDWKAPWVGGEHQGLMERPPDRPSKVQQNSTSLCMLMAHLTWNRLAQS